MTSQQLELIARRGLTLPEPKLLKVLHQYDVGFGELFWCEKKRALVGRNRQPTKQVPIQS